MRQKSLTSARLRELINYNSETGVFTRIAKTNRRQFIGEQCGYVNRQGYVVISVDGISHLAHRLAWLYMTGVHPKDEIDHADLSRSNNAWSNLREASRTQQAWNVSVKRSSKTGLKGVFFDTRRGTFYAQITRGGKNAFLGSRKTAQEAHDLYRNAVALERGEFGRAA